MLVRQMAFQKNNNENHDISYLTRETGSQTSRRKTFATGFATNIVKNCKIGLVHNLGTASSIQRLAIRNLSNSKTLKIMGRKMRISVTRNRVLDHFGFRLFFSTFAFSYKFITSKIMLLMLLQMTRYCINCHGFNYLQLIQTVLAYNYFSFSSFLCH